MKKESPLKKPILEEFAKTTYQQEKEQMIVFQKKIIDWQKRKKNIDNSIDEVYRLLELTPDKVDQLSSEELKRRIRALKSQKKLNTILQNSALILKEGQSLLYQIRQYYTGQEITYNILLTGGRKIGYREAVGVKEETVLKAATVDLRHPEQLLSQRTNAMRLILRNSQIKQALVNEEMQDLEQLEAVKNPLLIGLEQRQKQWRPNSGDNFGHLYEVYYALRNIKKFNPQTTLKTDLTKRLIQRMFEKSHNNVPAWKGGDYGITQLKAVARSAAQVVTMTSVDSMLQQLLMTFSLENERDIYNNLKQVFTKEKGELDNNLDKDANDEALLHLKTVFRNMGVNIR